MRLVDGNATAKLPRFLTRLVGREREAVVARASLGRGDTRWLTLTGPGGIGKTRLAVEVASGVATDFADGVCFVPLASLRDPDLVLPAVANAVGVRDGGDRPLVEHLVTHLRDRHLLLVLDNMEQVFGAATAVATLLEACSRLSVLVTSRVVLRVRGEQVLTVPPLDGPEAVSLFLQRAQMIDPDVALTDANVTTIAEVCNRLDGLPLAIELAAARLQVLSPSALLARLNHRLNVLARGARGAPERQRTLRNTLDWSHELLRPAEQVLFRRLAVFAGGCDAEAVEAVVALGGDAEPVPPLDTVVELLDSSLLQRSVVSGESRFTMLDTVREYALERLETSGEVKAARRRHAAYFLGLARQAQLHLRGPGSLSWLDRLEADHDNVRAALEWSLVEEPETALWLAAELWRFWWKRGHLREGRAWLERGLKTGEGATAAARAAALTAAGELAERHTDYDAATARYEEALPLWRDLGDTRGMAATLDGLAETAMRQGDYDRAAELRKQGIAFWRDLNDTMKLADSLGSLGALVLDQGHVEQAQALCAESLALWREVGDPHSISIGLQDLGYATLVGGDPERAMALYEESLALRREVGDRQGVAHLLANLAEAARRQGDVSRAEALANEAVPIFGDLGDRRGEAYALNELGRVAQLQGDVQRAASLLALSLTLFQQVGDRWAITHCLESFAGIASTSGQAEHGAALFGAAAALRDAIGTPLPPAERAEHDRQVAEVRVALGADTFASAWTRGASLPLTEAIAEACRVKPASPSSPRRAEQDHHVVDHRLTRRELEVLRLVAEGHSDRDIAEMLYISPRTATTHVKNLLRKLGVGSRTAAAAYAFREGFV